MAEFALRVNGMTCTHCERAVNAELLAVPGVKGVRVDAASGQVRITHDTALDRVAVTRAIEDAGYELRSWPTERDD